MICRSGRSERGEGSEGFSRDLGGRNLFERGGLVWLSFLLVFNAW
jgi:hypothetical protein